MDPVFQRRRRKERLYDKLHRGSVTALMGVTVMAALVLGYQVYGYFRYVRPLRSVQHKLAQEELLLEGRSIEDSANIDQST